jgi:hypothetical protein
LSERALAAAYAGHANGAGTAALSQRLLNIVLFVALLTSSIAFIEPSPHDALMLVLFAACVAARVRFDRKIVPLVLLLAIWLTGALFAVIPVLDQKQTVQYVATSTYLIIAAIMFACLFCDGDLVRLLILRRGYIIAALIATTAGYAGFFHLTAGSDIFLANDRVSATFKDPNVYGPFLIFPLLLLLIEFMTRGLRPISFAIMIFLVGGLFLSFSRGAWAHFAFSAIVAVALLLAAAPEPRLRRRVVLLSLTAVVGVVVFVVALISIPSVHDMFLERAKAIQPYDIGPGGRFWEQRLALGVILESPNGLGPFEFFRVYGTQQHDVYMQSFLVYGWIGGVAYIALVVVTLAVGVRTALVPAPWQVYLIAAYAAFVGEALEGFIVDTDHWRHFFLILGTVWGLTAASINLQRRESRARLLVA